VQVGCLLCAHIVRFFALWQPLLNSSDNVVNEVSLPVVLPIREQFSYYQLMERCHAQINWPGGVNQNDEPYFGIVIYDGDITLINLSM